MSKPPSAVAPRAFPRLFARNSQDLVLSAAILGRRRAFFSDVYYYLLLSPWSALVLFFSAYFLLINALFGLVFYRVGGVLHARPHHFLDSFFFSVQTLGTIGYGQMAPVGLGAQLTVTVETMVGMLSLALMTGIVFAKFSRPKARVMFSDSAVITARNGVPTFMFRVGNERANHVAEAHLRVTLVRNDLTQEGERFRKLEDLTLQRADSPAFILTWTALHAIDEKSPLHGLDAEQLQALQIEVLVTLTGIDATLNQTINARHSYIHSEIRWNERMVDLLSLSADGKRSLDYHKFHLTEPVAVRPKAPSVTVAPS